jgi:hypothetical protein
MAAPSVTATKRLAAHAQTLLPSWPTQRMCSASLSPRQRCRILAIGDSCPNSGRLPIIYLRVIYPYPPAALDDLPATDSGYGNLVEWLVAVSIKSTGRRVERWELKGGIAGFRGTARV